MVKKLTAEEIIKTTIGSSGFEEVNSEEFEEGLDFQPVEEELIDGLTEAEREEIDREAEDLIAKERKDRAKKNYKTLALARKRAEANVDVNDEQVVMHLDLPGHAPFISINGKRYYHDTSYTVGRQTANFLMEKQQWAWRHEEEIGGANRDIYRKPKELHIGSKQLGVPNQAILRG